MINHHTYANVKRGNQMTNSNDVKCTRCDHTRRDHYTRDGGKDGRCVEDYGAVPCGCKKFTQSKKVVLIQ